MTPSNAESTSPRRVLQVAGRTVGGAAEHALLLSRSLNSKRFDVSVMFPAGGPLDADFLGVPHIHVKVGPGSKDGGNLKAATAQSTGLLPVINDARAFDRFIASNDFDIVHTHTSFAGVVGRLSAHMRKVPIRIHMLHSYMSHEHVPVPKRQLFSAIERGLDRVTDHYIAGSEAIRQIGIRRGLFDAARASTIYYSIDIARHDARRLAGGAQLPASIPADAFVVGFVGRLEEQKNLDDLLRVVAEAGRGSIRPIHLLVIGDGSLRAQHQAEMSRLGLTDRTHWLGWQSNVAAWMEVIDVLALTSRWEAFGIVNLEAMASSKPCIAYGVEGIREVVEDGVTGVLVEQGDVGGLAAVMRKLTENREVGRVMGTAGRNRLERTFGHHTMVDAHQALYDRLLAERGVVTS